MLATELILAVIYNILFSLSTENLEIKSNPYKLTNVQYNKYI